MYKTLIVVFLVSISMSNASAELASRQRGDLQNLYNEITFCKATHHVVANAWIDLAWKNKEKDGKWTKLSRKMLKLSSELTELSHEFGIFQTVLGKILGFSEKTVFASSSDALDKANKVVPKDQKDLKRYLPNYTKTCTQVAQNTGKAVKDL